MSYLPDSRIAIICIHYSATPIENNYTCADIDRMHRERGFNEVGYHWYIRKNGLIEPGRDLTKPGRFEQGAHSIGENDISIGICFEGGVTLAALNTGFDSRTPAQIKSMIELIDRMLVRFPGAIIKGHRDMPGAATQCPGFNAREWWDSVLRRRLDPNQRTATQSTELRASAIGVVATGGTVATAVSSLDGNAQLIVAGAGVVVLLAFLWIMRKRIARGLRDGW